MADSRAPARRVFHIPCSHLSDLNERRRIATFKIACRQANLSTPTPGYLRTPKPQQNPSAGSLLPLSCGVGRHSRSPVYRPLEAFRSPILGRWHAIVGIRLGGVISPRRYQQDEGWLSSRSYSPPLTPQSVPTLIAPHLVRICWEHALFRHVLTCTST